MKCSFYKVKPKPFLFIHNLFILR